MKFILFSVFFMGFAIGLNKMVEYGSMILKYTFAYYLGYDLEEIG